MAPYFARQEFRFTPLLKAVRRPNEAFGFELVGNSMLLGADGKVLWRGLKFDRAAVKKALDIK